MQLPTCIFDKISSGVRNNKQDGAKNNKQDGAKNNKQDGERNITIANDNSIIKTICCCSLNLRFLSAFLIR